MIAWGYIVGCKELRLFREKWIFVQTISHFEFRLSIDSAVISTCNSAQPPSLYLTFFPCVSYTVYRSLSLSLSFSLSLYFSLPLCLSLFPYITKFQNMLYPQTHMYIHIYVCYQYKSIERLSCFALLYGSTERFPCVSVQYGSIERLPCLSLLYASIEQLPGFFLLCGSIERLSCFLLYIRHTEE